MKMRLNIQLFAEEMASDASMENESIATENISEANEMPSFNDLLKNPQYQREFDRLVGKSLETARTNWQRDYDAKLQAEKTEAEKLAKMDADQKMKYELNKMKQEKDALLSQINASNLYRTASDIANEKGLPIGYLELLDFGRESAESIQDKIEKLEMLRSRDLQNYLNQKLKQARPTERVQQPQRVDPYIEGFLSEM